MVWFTFKRSKEEYLDHYDEIIRQYENLTAGNTIEMYEI